MAKIEGVFYNWSGTVGNTVFAMWKSLQTIRSKNIPSNPQSNPQTAVRAKMRFMTERFSPLLDSWIHRYWDDLAKKNRSGWNEFISYNFNKITIADFKEIVLTKGNLLPVVNLKCNYNPATGDLTINWTDNTASDGSGSTDRVKCTLFDEEDVQFDTIIEDKFRPDGSATYNLPAGLSITNWVFFMCFDNEVQTKSGLKYVSSFSKNATPTLT